MWLEFERFSTKKHIRHRFNDFRQRSIALHRVDGVCFETKEVRKKSVFRLLTAKRKFSVLFRCSNSLVVK